MTINRAAYNAAKSDLERIIAERAALVAPTDAAYDAALTRMDDITDGAELVGKCDRCGEAVFEGEPYQNRGECIILCESHAAKLSEIIDDWKLATNGDRKVLVQDTTSA